MSEQCLTVVVDVMNVAVECRSAQHFKCENNVCLPQTAICDGYDHCGDGSDEAKQCGECLLAVAY